MRVGSLKIIRVESRIHAVSHLLMSSFDSGLAISGYYNMK